ncbi:MAG: nodW-4 [Bryobacterales bacterium]|nr:nodW-4 [Bryobacterales bacterium]
MTSQPTTDEPIVFVVDDDSAARAAAESLLHSVGLRVETFRSADDFTARALPACPTCLVLDVRLPETSGLELQRDLRTRGIDIPIIFITGHGDIPMSVEAMKAGAMEFLTKPFRGQVLLDAIHKALAADRALKLEKATHAKLRQRFDSLTPREHEVMEGVIAGKLNKEIATKLGTSERTIKLHRAALMRKMTAHSLPDLVRMYEKLRA